MLPGYATNRWFAERSNVNNAWIFNGNNGNLNNNNVNNTYQVGAVTNLSAMINNAMLGLTDEQKFIRLYNVMKKARKNKRRGRDSVAFEANWAPLLIRAMRDRDDRTLRIRENFAFLATRPRWREILATEFGGRMIDHEICEVVIPEAEGILSPYTYNNRKGKGSQGAINQLLEHLYDVTENYTKPARIVKIDFSGYFPNAMWDVAERCVDEVIDHAGLDETTRSYLKWLTMISVNCNPAGHCEFRTSRTLWADHIDPEKSILTKPEGVGAAIGRLIWQTSMGLYVNDEIRWLTEECGLKLVCFVDDIVFVVPEERHSYLLSLLPELRRRLAEKNVRLNEKKFYDQRAVNGFEFLGSHISPNRIHLNSKTFDSAIRAVVRLRDNPHKDIDRMAQTFNSYGGMLKGRTDHKRLMDLQNMLNAEWWRWLAWDKNRQCVIYRPAFAPTRRLDNKYHLHLKRYRNDKRRNQPAAQ